MSNNPDGPSSEDDGAFTNIFATDGEDYYHLSRDQSSPARGAYTALLENISFMIKEGYGANDQFCLVIPQGPLPEPYKDYVDLIHFENHDGADSTGKRVMERREASTRTLSDFLFHLRLTLSGRPDAENVSIEEQGQGVFAVATKDTRTLIYALAIMAAQKGFETGLYPLARQGKPLSSSQKGEFMGAAVGDIKPFLRAEAGLPALPHSFKEIIGVFNAGRSNVPVPAFKASPLAESIPYVQ
jgi:hypothetical protein